MNAIKQEDQTSNDFVKSELGALNLLHVGDLVQGAIIEKGVRMMTIDLGANGVGAVYRGELQNAREVIKSLKPGDMIGAKVVQIDNEDGYIELSLTQADKQKAWEEVQDLRDQEEIVKVKLTAFNKGGLLGELRGLPAFLPVSQLGNGLEGRAINNKEEIGKVLQELVGKEVDVRIIDVNSRTNKLIVSEKAATEVSTKELVQNYQVGQIIDGVVSGVADFGVFIRFTDNPALEGLIHISELGYRIVENPKEIVKIDDAVKAKITDIRDGKISLSLRALRSDPWTNVGEKYKEGQELSGMVHSFHPFGAIVNLDGEIQGQVHVASFGSVEEMKKQLGIGKEYSFIVESLVPTERKILLKLK